MNDYRSNPNRPIDLIDALCKNISDINGQTDQVQNGLEGINKELDQRIKDLEDYLKKFNEL